MKISNENDEAVEIALLDQLSTSQRLTETVLENCSHEAAWEVQHTLLESKRKQTETCPNHAPYIFYVDNTKRGRLVQGCCNNWRCPRCGYIRARTEYGRIVAGARELGEAGRALYFWTITCRGREVSLSEAETNYKAWTNHLLTRLRDKCKTAEGYWCYVQVTERQKRQHPHSHFISSYCPDDAVNYQAGETLPNGRKAKHDLLWSPYFRQKNIDAGLGAECDISAIKNPVAVAVYVSKYLFKDAVNTEWPSDWRRVRYSQNWPKVEHKKPEIAFPVIKLDDWLRLDKMGVQIFPDSIYTHAAAQARGVRNLQPAP